MPCQPCGQPVSAADGISSRPRSMMAQVKVPISTEYTTGGP